MTSIDKYKLYLEDLGVLLKEHALDAKERLLRSQGKEKEFDQGVLFAYYRILSMMQQQALAFDIDLGKIKLDDINPDKQLT